jgi:topoisomerase-4 subunit B
MGKNVELQRYKGLGEMMPEQLWETTMNPETRTLIQVRIEDEALSLKRVTTLMGDNVEMRRKWIESNVSFTLEDADSILGNEDVTKLGESGELND